MKFLELAIVIALPLLIAFTTVDILATKRATGVWQLPPWLKAAWRWVRSRVGK